MKEEEGKCVEVESGKASEASLKFEAQLAFEACPQFLWVPYSTIFCPYFDDKLFFSSAKFPTH